MADGVGPGGTDRPGDRGAVADVDAGAAAEHGDVVAGGVEGLADGSPEVSVAARDEYPHAGR
ncbi:hypothetical protein Psuf_033740 [Phytohabitans suffuscus]|uniref:Uncharacterized protein n=1 Tax=Phytohabitans suffuscus TaxID=624315 RepID=A0A6F8YJD8_9ACTN|nr:hypothetical protein Psuf_033740 [Phytohabitans suffuscus]